jgi:hypothetical protein
MSHVCITIGQGYKSRYKCINDPSPYCRGDDLVGMNDRAIRMLTAMLAGDLLLLRNGFLFADGNRRFYLYGNRLSHDECATAMLLLLHAGLIRPMTDGSSPAITQQAVTEYGFEVAKEIPAFQTEVYRLV